MIVVRLMGGLGNQLFQYAAAKHLALLNNAEVFVDTTFLELDVPNTTKRPFELNAFNASFNIADDALLKSFHGPDFSTSDCLITKIKSFGNRNKYKFNDQMNTNISLEDLKLLNCKARLVISESALEQGFKLN